MGDVATAFAIGAGITAGLYAGRGFRNRPRKVRIGITVFNAYFGLIYRGVGDCSYQVEQQLTTRDACREIERRVPT